MTNRLILALLAALSVIVIPTTRADTPIDQRLVVAETSDVFRLSVPVSRLIMTIPRSEFAVVHDSGSGGTASPRYFHLEDTAHGIIISGWFEPANLYRGIKQFWKGEIGAWKKSGAPMPRNESFQNADKWEMVLYDGKVPGGSNTHIRAEWVELDTWIDIHISVTTADPIDAARTTAMKVLRGIRVVSAP